jgi:hypothetical protein
MDGGQSYSPDLSKLTAAQVNAWADATAETYCSFDVIDGIQLDLEPSRKPYYDNLLIFIARLSSNLRSKERNCVSVAHPEGRSLSTFIMAENITPGEFSKSAVISPDLADLASSLFCPSLLLDHPQRCGPH